MNNLTLNDLAAIYVCGALFSVMLSAGVIYVFAEEYFYGFSEAARNALIFLGMFVWPFLILFYAAFLVWGAGYLLYHGTLHIGTGIAELWRTVMPLTSSKLPKARVIK